MSTENGGPATLRKLGRVERKAVNLGGGEAAVRTGEVRPGETLPLVVTPRNGGMSLNAWAAANLEWIEGKLLEHGAVLFRGWDVGGLDGFREFVTSTGGSPEKYTYRSTPRTEVGNGIYTSTEYPADKFIPMHNEHSYSRSWPLRLFFFGEQPSPEGGMTPIADSARVYAEIPAEIREKFERKRVMYVRNYGEGVDLPWEEVFGTSNRAEVESFCAAEGIEVEWKEGGRLRTRQVCQAIARHPATGRTLWFNQAHLFHVSSLEAEVAEALVEAFGDDGVPRNTFYGDGEPIEPEALAAIRAAYDRVESAFPWEKDDVVMIDNMAVAHARTPFRGERKIRAAMTQPVHADDLVQP
ncbi:TauD/TfdA family dioxygenase [Longimicrobium terrae]|uniref:Alpha-ketoglutarate-dependent taurine dioxygenase n=1 Tax=Longimicrobium terrae TaxID=1639882 RepID=A0A841GLI8_9BACT|nr:TauD/TfdA family dioxygenase [Longimicrobium terrae]MBB4635063.1 alpha-ketoglutarate-dependent taurine dioxygenase [Longimicrobium terrae]MBB6069457.1 alpha-ketoglutarate-dependent taurine dioxygenase [Longimicrobium terrae]NNC31740.1 TauD/TfdA family dioxygenase [Longimicrobium terrae]